MLESEINEISSAFSDAWQQYFGQPMYYIPMDELATEVHPIYGDTKVKAYKESSKISFYGTFKQSPIDEKGEMMGREIVEMAEITYVTKDLEDKGITEVQLEDMIEMTDKAGVTKRYNIIQYFGKVQFGDSRIFTKLKVAWYKYAE
jgi:hypothetical protein